MFMNRGSALSNTSLVRLGLFCFCQHDSQCCVSMGTSTADGSGWATSADGKVASISASSRWSDGSYSNTTSMVVAQCMARFKGIWGVSNEITFVATYDLWRGDVMFRFALEKVVLDVAELLETWVTPSGTGSSGCCTSWVLLISSKMLVQSTASAADWGFTKIDINIGRFLGACWRFLLCLYLIPGSSPGSPLDHSFLAWGGGKLNNELKGNIRGNRRIFLRCNGNTNGAAVGCETTGCRKLL